MAAHVCLLAITILAISRAVSAPAYETPPVLDAWDLLPGYLIMGEEFAVDEAVRNDGHRNHYTVRSVLGDEEAEGRDDLERIIQEIRATAYLREQRVRTGAVVGFNQGMKNLAAAPYHKVKQVAFDPLYAIEAVPAEIADYAGKVATVGDLVKYGPRVFIRRSLGIDGARKDLARRLQVSSSTDSEALQEEIRRVGWGIWLGGIGPDIGDGAFELGVDLSTEVGNLGNGNLGRAVAAIRREVLPRSGRRLLKKVDVPKRLIADFLDHPYYDGRMREDLATALTAIPDTTGKEDFISWALRARDEIEAREIVGLAQIIALHNDEVEPVIWIRGEGDVLLFRTPTVTVVPFVHDYLIWSEPVDQHMAKAREMVGESPAQALACWTLGEFSPRLQDQLEASGFALRTDIDRDYPVFERPRKGLKRLEQQYEREIEDPLQMSVQEKFFPDSQPRLVLKRLGSEQSD